MPKLADKSSIVVEDVSVVFRNESNSTAELVALSEVTFDVKQGEILCVLGPNGCGKSTLLLVSSGLLKPTTGSVAYPSTTGHDGRLRRAVVFQDFGLFHWMTVWQNVEFGLKPLDYSKVERTKIVKESIERVGLTGFEKSYPRQLSGGMQQRVAIARALSISPEFLFLDEPFASLDSQTRDLMQEEFVSLLQDRSVTTFFVTHNVDEAVYMSDRVIVLTKRPGRVKLIITVPFLYPRSPELRVTPDFLELKASIWRALREEINRRDHHDEA